MTPEKSDQTSSSSRVFPTEWSSPVLGESVSMYERESDLAREQEEHQMFDNILDRYIYFSE